MLSPDTLYLSSCAVIFVGYVILSVDLAIKRWRKPRKGHTYERKASDNTAEGPS